jgi:hypothetical protein
MKTILTKGTRIYYGGDMANDSGFGTITSVSLGNWGTHYHIKYDDGRKMAIQPCAFSPEYLGHGGTRFVTLDAYNKFRGAQLREIGYSEQKITEYKAA